MLIIPNTIEYHNQEIEAIRHYERYGVKLVRWETEKREEEIYVWKKKAVS